MKKRMIMTLAAGLLAMSLTGCGENQIPEMTEEQMQMIGEYAAVTLMKFDASNRSRLVDISLLGLPDPTPEPVPTPTPPPAGMDPVDDTPIVNAGTGTSNTATMEDVLELPESLSITYTGEALYKTYPEGDSDSFSMTAVEGRQFLVLNFAITNASEQEQAVDFLSMAPEFRITVNGDYTRKTLMTVFENDMAFYSGSVPALQSVPVVLIIEVEDAYAANLSSISLKLKNASKTYTIQLL